MSSKIASQCLCVVLSVLFVCSCGVGNNRSYSDAERHATDSIVKSERNITGLDSLYIAMKNHDNVLGQIVVLREKGKLMRNESQFSAALHAHGEGLRLAEKANDTIEWVQALNNIGTDYRRLGLLDMAQRYHYAAWMMAEECCDTTFMAKKNRVVSLNGLANIYLTTNNLSRADSVLRLALAGEAELGSLTGQAINYANLGSIFEHRGNTDSAWTYYRKSMELNQKDNNMLGIALCHNYFGDLYKQSHRYDSALQEYEKSYSIMKNSKDEWHSLNSLIALADVWELKGNFSKAKAYLDEAQGIAKGIKSNEHLAEIYKLYYKMYKLQGDYRFALSYHELAGALEDSLIDMDKVNRMQNTTLDLERERQARLVAEANDKLTQEQSVRHIGSIVFVIVVLLMGGFIGMLVHTRHVRAKSHTALKRLNTMRETFFTNITHEFRTPLTVILGLSQDLQKSENTTDEVQDMGLTIERQGRRMLRLINQLLDISKIRSAIGTPDWRSGNIVAYINMIVETYTDYAKRLGIKLQFIARDKEIDTDFVPDYINKVISNLLSNSLKFTEKYGTVNVNMWRKEHQIFIDVADNGRGISPESLPHIFDEFYQAGSSDEGIGTGVGLALVHQIVKSLDGNITVDSIVGKGTTFHIVLPMRKVHEATPVSLSNGVFEPDIVDKPDAENTVGVAVGNDTDNQMEQLDSAKRVLVVEDNADIAAFIGKRLSDNYLVAFASDGNKGLEKALEWMPDIIITDLMMPVMDGLELCRKIRSNELTCHIPIIVVTAKVSEAERVEGLKAGADAYLAKPFSSDELKMRVQKLLEQRQMLRDKFAKDIDSSMGYTSAANQKPKDGKLASQGTDNQVSDLDRRFLNKVTDCVYLMLNGHKSVDVGAVASQLCMSYGQFNRKLSALTGFTPAQYIQRVKIKKAQRMLVSHPELGFNDIAEQCGFSDYSNFVRAFKNVCGVTPTQFVRK